MKARLAEQVIARTLEWDPVEAAAERPWLQAMADYKYDEYQQFSPGMRFLESLALWLNQFGTPGERRLAYDFVKRRLIYCSSAEMTHFVETAYPDLVRPVLIRHAAGDMGCSPYQIARAAARADFRLRQRQCLILGLSDGARIDAFRRANRELDQEQVWQTYELSSQRVGEMLDKLSKHVGKITDGKVQECKFQTIVLLDDFSASGTSTGSRCPSLASVVANCCIVTPTCTVMVMSRAGKSIT